MTRHLDAQDLAALSALREVRKRYIGLSLTEADEVWGQVEVELDAARAAARARFGDDLEALLRATAPTRSGT